MRDWLQIQPNYENTIFIQQLSGFHQEAVKNQLWYRGEPSELEQYFKQSEEISNSFWSKCPPSDGLHKIHSGLPSLLVDTIANIVISDMSDISFKNDMHKSIFDEFLKENDFTEILLNAVTDTLVSGDGAFKIAVDSDISDFPIVQFYSANDVEYITSNGRITAIEFYTDYYIKNRKYKLKEIYSAGRIDYRLYLNESEISLDTIPELSKLENGVVFDSKEIFAVPMRFFRNPKYRERGKSVYASKTGCFDALDEIISEWIDAVRSGRVRTYIPDTLIPRNPENGGLLKFNQFGDRIISVNNAMTENADNKIQVVQPDINYEAYLSSYTNALEMCLQGIVSPATLGIDLSKISSADAQREKKDVTGITRNKITTVLEKTIPRLVRTIMTAYSLMHGNEVENYEPSVTFGEYGSPSFDSRIDSVSKASQAGIMSIESQIDELWGNSKDDEWKKKEAERIRNEKGILTSDEPALDIF